MARYARLEAPGAVHHLVSRFVNEEFRFTGTRERRHYLEQVPRALARSDWNPNSYCLMSSHTHLGARAGVLPSASFIKPLNVGVAGWLNKTQDRLGPVFADRHRSIVVCDGQRVARLVAYIHNNPVRAGVVRDPADSDWSSHRAYLGLVKPPPWLDVERGLSECGFDSSSSGRLAFHEFVVSLSGELRSEELSGAGIAKQRAQIRAVLGSSIECSWPSIPDPSTGQAIELLSPMRRAVAWPGAAADVVRVVANYLGIAEIEILGRGRQHHLSGARRLLLHLWTVYLGRSQTEMRALLGLSSSRASELLRSPHADWKALSAVCRELDREVRQKI
jgi:hypothetical protein